MSIPRRCWVDLPLFPFVKKEEEVRQQIRVVWPTKNSIRLDLEKFKDEIYRTKSKIISSFRGSYYP